MNKLIWVLKVLGLVVGAWLAIILAVALFQILWVMTKAMLGV